MHLISSNQLIALVFVAFFFFVIPQSANAGYFTATNCELNSANGSGSLTPSPGFSPENMKSSPSLKDDIGCNGDAVVIRRANDTAAIGDNTGMTRYYRVLKTTDYARVESIKTTVERSLKLGRGLSPCVWIKMSDSSKKFANFNSRSCRTNSVPGKYFTPETTQSGASAKINITNTTLRSAGLPVARSITDYDNIELWMGLLCTAEVSCGRIADGDLQRISWSNFSVLYKTTPEMENTLSNLSYYPKIQQATNNIIVGSGENKASAFLSEGSTVIKCPGTIVNQPLVCPFDLSIPYSASSSRGIGGAFPVIENGPIVLGSGNIRPTCSTVSVKYSFFNPPCPTEVTGSLLGPYQAPANLSSSNFNSWFSVNAFSFDGTGSSYNFPGTTFISQIFTAGTRLNFRYGLDNAPPLVTWSGTSSNWNSPDNRIDARVTASDAFGLSEGVLTRTLAYNPNSLGECEGGGSGSVPISSDTNPWNSSEPKNYQTSVNVSSLTDGSCYWFSFNVSDKKGFMRINSSSINDSAFITGASKKIMVDTVAPTTSFSNCQPTLPDGPNGWYLTGPVCEFEAFDNASRPAESGGRVELSENGGQLYKAPETLLMTGGVNGEKTRTASYQITGNSSQVVARAYSLDRSGRESAKTIPVGPFKIDTSPPKISFEGAIPPATVRQEIAFPAVSVFDQASGVEEVEIQYQNALGEWEVLPGTSCSVQLLEGQDATKKSKPCRFNALGFPEGSYSFRYLATDLVGREGVSRLIKVKIDKSAPILFGARINKKKKSFYSISIKASSPTSLRFAALTNQKTAPGPQSYGRVVRTVRGRTVASRIPFRPRWIRVKNQSGIWSVWVRIG